MASDLSSGSIEAIGMLDEKEEGEISLEDVSSTEEGHLNYGYETRISQCSNCLSTQHNAKWCTAPLKFYQSIGSNRRAAVQGKENRHQIKESGCIGAKHIASTLQEKNDDLVFISSDSDMEIVGLADNSKQIVIRSASKTKVKKKKKRKRTHASMLSVDDLVSSSTVDDYVSESVNPLKYNTVKSNSRSHRREMSPVRRSNRSRGTLRSPIRKHRSLIRTHSPSGRSKSPLIRSRSPTIRRSPRRVKSPKRSPYRSPGKSIPRKTSHLDVKSSSHNYVDTYKLLEKVRQLKSKNKIHVSSLKEKLTNTMKGICDNNNEMTNASKEKFNICINEKEHNDADDEEDLALLRQKALETKQKKSNKQNDQPKTETVKKISANIDDDQDEEDLELRMIALRSAVLKKHQNKVQEDMKSEKHKKSNTIGSESPFTQSFLDSFYFYSGEELLNFASPPHTPLPMNKLDTDVEREKEKLPYSPTDKITANVSMDTELLGIQPSDVSFINLNTANNSPNFNTCITFSQDDQKSYQGKIIENRSYLPNAVYSTSSQNASYTETNINMQYAPTDLAQSSRPESLKVHNAHVNTHHYENMSNVLKDNNTSNFIDINSSQEMPYSPTDTPVYDPDLPRTLGPIATSNSSLVSVGSSSSSNTHENNEQCNHMSIIQQIQTTTQIKNEDDDENLDKVKTLSMDLTDNAKEIIFEPFYMKGVPDVTKDVNKIPTLINRTLVPAPILKTNKQLQQPLPVKKLTTQQEPTFKSAEMQPIVISDKTSIKTNTSFKPMKLISFPQKSHSVLTIPTAFHESLHEDSTNETLTNENTSLMQSNKNAILVQNNGTVNMDKTLNNVNSIQKKKKVVKKGLKRKCTDTVAKEHNAISSNNNSINLLNKMAEPVHAENKEFERCEDNNGQPYTESSGNLCNSEDTQNIVNQMSQMPSKKNENQLKDKTTLSNDVIDQAKNANDRRQSLDEDEEALRAILLASLPKRTKTTNSISDSTAVTSASTVVSSVTDTINTTNTNSISVQSTLHGNCGSENDKNQSNSAEKVNNAIAREHLSTSRTTRTPVCVTSGSKRSVPMNKGPQKKLVKKSTIPARTKVVYNAKKYENNMFQLLLDLQKTALYDKQKIVKNKTSSKLQPNDNKWSANTKTPLSDTQRIVINLESDTESDSESERQKTQTISSVNSLITEKQQPTMNSTTEFEKNLDQFLRTARKKHESMAAARPTSVLQTFKKNTVLTTKPENSNSSNLHMPLAVRHLPASQQEEYRRLKQQIIEREKLKLHRTVENNNSMKNKNTEMPSTSISSKSPNKESCSKINQTMPGKSQSVHAQLLNKENCSKNLDSTKNTPTLDTNNIQLHTNKVHGSDKEENTNPNQSKTISRATTNLNVRISNENSPNNVGNKTVGNPLLSITTSREVFESPTNDISTRMKLSPSLKILSTDEVNRKYVHVQVKNDTNERVVTINEKETSNDKTVITRDENFSESKDTNRDTSKDTNRDTSKETERDTSKETERDTSKETERDTSKETNRDTSKETNRDTSKETNRDTSKETKRDTSKDTNRDISKETKRDTSKEINRDTGKETSRDTHDHDINQFIQSVEKEITTASTESNNNDAVDSDTSTIITRRENQIVERTESLDTSESTIPLSQYEEDSRTSTILNSGSKDEGHFLLCNSRVLNDKKRIEKNWEIIKRDVKTKLNALTNLPRFEQRRHLIDTEQKLVLKRYTILNELAEMSVNLRRWHIEQDIQAQFVTEVKKLRVQLEVAEETLQLQRNRINNIAPKVVAAHGKINADRQECFKLATICSTLGSKIIGKAYKVPDGGAQLLDSKLKEVANHTRQLSQKRVPSIDIPEVYGSTKSEDIIVSTDISQSEDLLLEEDNVNNVNTIIPNEDECLTVSNTSESDVSTKATTIDSKESSEREENPATNNLLASINKESISQQRNTEKEVFIEQLDSSSTLSIPVLKDSQDSDQKESSQDKVVKLNSTSEPGNQNMHQTKRIIIPYESILLYFKVPRNANPNGVLCPYELMGTCSDGDCQFVHQRESQAK